MLDCFIAYAIRNDVLTLKYCIRHCERSEAIQRIYRGNVNEIFHIPHRQEKRFSIIP